MISQISLFYVRFLLLYLVIFGMIPEFSIAQSQQMSGELIVKFKPKVSEKKKSSIHAAYGGTVMEDIKALNIYRLKIPVHHSLQDMAQIYKQNPLVEYVEKCLDKRRRFHSKRYFFLTTMAS